MTRDNPHHLIQQNVKRYAHSCSSSYVSSYSTPVRPINLTDDGNDEENIHSTQLHMASQPVDNTTHTLQLEQDTTPTITESIQHSHSRSILDSNPNNTYSSHPLPAPLHIPSPTMPNKTPIALTSLVILALIGMVPCHAFVPAHQDISTSSSASALNMQKESTDRRSFVQAAVGLGLIAMNPTPAQARDDLFKKNPLTNPMLEQIRIWEQAEADNIKYSGELEAGDAGNKGKVDAYPKLLMPILEIDYELTQVKKLVRDESRWPDALTIMQQKKYEKIPFKKAFNAYGDNIYYSDPDRANVYLGGGATPKTEQSLAYLLRNDVLTNVENLRAELEYLMKSGEKETEDLYKFADIATNAMKKYLAIVPPGELEQAKALMDKIMQQ